MELWTGVAVLILVSDTDSRSIAVRIPRRRPNHNWICLGYKLYPNFSARVARDIASTYLSLYRSRVLVVLFLTWFFRRILIFLVISYRLTIQLLRIVQIPTSLQGIFNSYDSTMVSPCISHSAHRCSSFSLPYFPAGFTFRNLDTRGHN